MADVTIQSVTKRFGTTTALDRVNLSMKSGEFVALLGPSGCGKTTLLRLLAGFEQTDGGQITIDERAVSGPGRHVPPEKRGIGMVFQAYALWPHMSVADNVGYALSVRRTPKADKQQAVAAALDAVGLKGYGDRKPTELSGGQRQRVALARCLAMQPRLVLLDEPLANLDVHLRDSMQTEFQRVHRTTGASMVYVTHDQAEAMALADRIAVMRGGVIQQIADPATLYHRPATPMVAEFVGRGMVVPVTVQGREGSRFVFADVWGAPALLRADDLSPGAAQACLRSEGLEIAAAEAPGIEGTVLRTVFHGAATTVFVRPIADPSIELRLTVREDPPHPGDGIRLAIRDAWRLPGSVAPTVQ